MPRPEPETTEEQNAQSCSESVASGILTDRDRVRIHIIADMAWFLGVKLTTAAAIFDEVIEANTAPF